MPPRHVTKSLAALAGLLLAFTASASAQLFTNVPTGPSAGLPFAYFGNAANPAGDAPLVGEVFTLATASMLDSFSYYAVGNTSAPIQLNVAVWNPSTNVLNQAVNAVGAGLLTTVINAVETYNPVGDYTTLAFNNLNLSLAADTKYIAYMSSTDSTLTHLQLSRTQTSQDATGFGQGLAFLSTIPGQGWQVSPSNGFLSLQYSASVSAIPEPSTYAALLGAVTLGVVAIRRKRMQAI